MRRPIEQVDAHAGQVGPAVRLDAEPRQPVGLGADPAQLLGGLRLLLEVDHPARVVDPHDPARLGFGLGDRQGGDRGLGLVLQVRADHVLEVHPVELVAGEDQDEVVARTSVK